MPAAAAAAKSAVLRVLCCSSCRQGGPTVPELGSFPSLDDNYRRGFRSGRRCCCFRSAAAAAAASSSRPRGSFPSVEDDDACWPSPRARRRRTTTTASNTKRRRGCCDQRFKSEAASLSPKKRKARLRGGRRGTLTIRSTGAPGATKRIGSEPEKHCGNTDTDDEAPLLREVNGWSDVY